MNGVPFCSAICMTIVPHTLDLTNSDVEVRQLEIIC